MPNTLDLLFRWNKNHKKKKIPGCAKASSSSFFCALRGNLKLFLHVNTSLVVKRRGDAQGFSQKHLAVRHSARDLSEIYRWPCRRREVSPSKLKLLPRTFLSKIISVKLHLFIYLFLSCMNAPAAPSAAHCLRLKAPLAQFVQPPRPVATAAASVRRCNPSRFGALRAAAAPSKSGSVLSGKKKNKKNGEQHWKSHTGKGRDKRWQIASLYYFSLFFPPFGLLIYFRVFFCGRDKAVAALANWTSKEQLLFLIYFSFIAAWVRVESSIQTERNIWDERFTLGTYATSITRWRQLQYVTLQISPPWSVCENTRRQRWWWRRSKGWW